MKRSKLISFAVTPEEYDSIKGKSASLNMTTSSYLRFIANAEHTISVQGSGEIKSI